MDLECIQPSEKLREIEREQQQQIVICQGHNGHRVPIHVRQR